MDDLLERLARFEKSSLSLHGGPNLLHEAQCMLFAASGRFLPSEQLSHLVDTAAAARARTDARAWSALRAPA